MNSAMAQLLFSKALARPPHSISPSLSCPANPAALGQGFSSHHVGQKAALCSWAVNALLSGARLMKVQTAPEGQRLL